ncbi:MAG: FUSC family protein [Methylophaga sp.]|uniref:FUSC family protein n=1 Tax=Methylophaga sp. UBA678 TaxID=1946901 RepID=UPI000C4B1FD4|nr:FUSC family protein [Methylophaga sp. UBA678]MAX50865.1 FUSC family protein [Methylophaga sp.]|tara:strand:- start:54277 stop:56418 length:2142 start_codon:yes stop_codon:yes gene_type:complete
MASNLTLSLKQAAKQWLNADGLTWNFIIQGLVAVFLTLWLAMRLELPQPAVASITVIIVMQPQSGQVLVKGLFRFLGTLIGCVVMLILVALVAQERVLFLLAAAVWIGLCAAGAMAFRDYRSYAFVLAGYTATLIGIPAIQNPDMAFMLAVWRVLEISLGIFIATVISATLFPQTSGQAIQKAVSQRFGDFADFIINSLDNPDQQTHYETKMMTFATQSVYLENLSYVSGIEDYSTKIRKQRLARLNQEFMQLTTRYAGLHTLLGRVRQDAPTSVMVAIERCLKTVKQTLAPVRQATLTSQQALDLAKQIDYAQTQLRQKIREEREFLPGHISEATKLDFDTACELIFRLFDEMRVYCETQSTLAAEQHHYERQRITFSTKMNPIGALITGLRTSLIVLLFGTFWIETAWPSGNTFAMVAIAISAIVTTTPNPARSAKQITVGTVAAALAGFVVNLLLLPHLDGFALLCFALALPLTVGLYLSTKPKYAGYGMGLLIFFCLGAIPLNQAVYNSAATLNNYIALILAQSMVVVILTVIIPADNRFVWQRLNTEMRHQISTLFSRQHSQRRHQFESQTRDLLSQSYGFAGDSPQQYKKLLKTCFSVQIVGHALMEIDDVEQRLSAAAGLNDDWKWYKQNLNKALISVFETPTAQHRVSALGQLDKMIGWLQPYTSDIVHFDESIPKQILSYLHFIRNVLLDKKLFAEPLVAGVKS